MQVLYEIFSLFIINQSSAYQVKNKKMVKIMIKPEFENEEKQQKTTEQKTIQL